MSSVLNINRKEIERTPSFLAGAVGSKMVSFTEIRHPVGQDRLGCKFIWDM